MPKKFEMPQFRQILQKTQKNENVLKTCLKRVSSVLEAERTIFGNQLQHLNWLYFIQSGK